MYKVITKGTLMTTTSPDMMSAASAVELVERATKLGMTATVTDSQGNVLTMKELHTAADAERT
jgi:hypothetical protein